MLKFQPILFLLAFFACSNRLQAQENALGTWTAHLPMNQIEEIEILDRFIYARSKNGLLIYDRSKKVLEAMTTVQGLSGVGLTALEISSNDEVLIGYQDGTLEIIQGKQIFTFKDIVRSNILGSKSIQSIKIYNDKAYLSCAFGIVVFDLDKQEFLDTYIIGDNATNLPINDLEIFNDSIFAATSQGVKKAALQGVNLIDFSNWKWENRLPSSNFKQMVRFKDRLITFSQGESFNTDTLYGLNNNWELIDPLKAKTIRSINASVDEIQVAYAYSVTMYDEAYAVIKQFDQVGQGTFEPLFAYQDIYNHYWIGCKNQGFLHYWFGQNLEILNWSGPSQNNAFRITAAGNQTFITAGGYDNAWSNIFNRDGFSVYEDYSWKNIDLNADSLYDAISAIPHPTRPEQWMVATWNHGILEYQDGILSQQYHLNNSTLQAVGTSLPTSEWVRTGAMAYDEQGNFWVTNSGVDLALSVMNPDGDWQAFNLKPNISKEDKVDRIIITQNNQKWIQVRFKGVVVFDHGESIEQTGDDRMLRLAAGEGNGNLPSVDVLCMAEDLDGEIWIGTGQGLAVVYSPEFIFDNPDIEAQAILIEDQGVVNQLFENEGITAIAVDGANRKWIGTSSSGLFLVSENGQETLLNFTTDNSPLFSNRIQSLAVDPKTGQVFIGTDEGLLAYKGSAVEGFENFESIYAYPNPVRPEYQGPIAIKGLVAGTRFKITDVSGNLVFDGMAQGGQAIWDGKTLSGDPVRTGVYLVFITDYDGSQTAVTKIAVIR